ncbi:MAG TPA: 2'-5' RNA ligase family protein [Sphingomicrobium sp.]|nr:2'-5' RNA ligase family protein [Sphingomicrobium sp.]
MSGALIVTAELAAADFAWLDGLRRRHYPAERNRVPAHLTIFHALPPSAEGELRSRLAALTGEPAPRAVAAGVMDLGGGVAFRIVSDELDWFRERLADDLHGLLGAQDSRGWRPHVTVQNKVAPRTARQLKAELERGFQPRPLQIAGIGLHRYREGEWETLAVYRFRGR